MSNINDELDALEAELLSWSGDAPLWMRARDAVANLRTNNSHLIHTTQAQAKRIAELEAEVTRLQSIVTAQDEEIFQLMSPAKP